MSTQEEGMSIICQCRVFPDDHPSLTLILVYQTLNVSYHSSPLTRRMPLALRTPQEFKSVRRRRVGEQRGEGSPGSGLE